MPLLYARRAVTIPQPDSITVLSGQYQIIRIVNLQFAFTLHVSEQLAQSDDIKVERPGVERTTSWSQVRRLNHYTSSSPVLRCLLQLVLLIIVCIYKNATEDSVPATSNVASIQ